MRMYQNIYKAPQKPAVYALYGGTGAGKYVAYVGIAGKLKQRLIQHFVRKDSSVTTGTAAVCLKPEYVTKVAWWEHPDFEKAECLKAAEIIAFEVLNPALRSRAPIEKAGKNLIIDPVFNSKVRSLFEEEPTGTINLPTLSDLFDRVDVLEGRLAALEKAMLELRNKS